MSYPHTELILTCKHTDIFLNVYTGLFLFIPCPYVSPLTDIPPVNVLQPLVFTTGLLVSLIKLVFQILRPLVIDVRL